MEILKNLDEFKKVFRVGKKWSRCQEAIANKDNIKKNCFYSIGDSLIYMIGDGQSEIAEHFIGHRRYMDVHYYFKGSQKIEITEKSKLTPIQNYSDETDYEFLSGQGEKFTLEEGNLIIIENHEAFRFEEVQGVEKFILKVSVEDNYFLNK